MEGFNRIDGTHDLTFWVAAPGVRDENKCRVCGSS